MFSSTSNRNRISGFVEGAVLVIVLGLYLFPGCNDGYSIYDEGIAVYGAERVGHGQVPYRDFWTIYAPGQYYLLAVMFKIFGTSLIVERVCSTVTLLALCVLLYAIARRQTSRSIAAMTALLAAIWLGGVKFLGSPMPSALAFAMGSAYFCSRYVEQPCGRFLFWTGLCGGAATLFRHDIGVYTLVAESIFILVCSFLSGQRDAPGAGRRKSMALHVANLLGGYLLIIVPVGLYFLFAVSWDDLYGNLFVFPTTVYREMRHLPFPSLMPPNMSSLSLPATLKGVFSPTNPSLPYYIPMIVYLFAAVFLAFKIITRGLAALTTRRRVILFFLLLGGLFLFQGSVRCDIFHFIPTFLPTIIVSGLLIAEVGMLRNRRIIAVLLPLGVVLVSAVSVQRPTAAYRLDLIGESLRGVAHCALPAPRASGIRIDGDCSVYGELIQYLRDSVAAGETIFVGNSRHDRIVKNDILLYFLADRESAVKYHELHPGLATTASVQQAIVNDISERDVRYVVLCDIKGAEPNESSVSSGVCVLDDYLRRTFPIVKQFGIYSVGRRNF